MDLILWLVDFILTPGLIALFLGAVLAGGWPSGAFVVGKPLDETTAASLRPARGPMPQRRLRTRRAHPQRKSIAAPLDDVKAT